MAKETKESKRKEIAEAKEGFLETMGLEDIHYGDTFFFEDIALRGIKPIRLLVDAIDNMQCENNYEGIPILLNEVQKKLDEFMEHCQKWDDEEREVEKQTKEGQNPFPGLAYCDQEKIMVFLENIEHQLGVISEPFKEVVKALDAKRKVSDTETAHKDAGAE